MLKSAASLVKMLSLSIFQPTLLPEMAVSVADAGEGNVCPCISSYSSGSYLKTCLHQEDGEMVG